MGLNLNGHVEEEELERYSARALSEARAEQVEEHLLVCEACRVRLDEVESFARGVAAAGRKLREERSPKVWLGMRPHTVMALAASIVLAAGLVAVQRAWVPRPEAAPLAVVLQASRGAGGAAQAPAGIRLALQPDLSGIPASGRYFLEIVDTAGTALWQGTIAAQAPRAVTPPRSPGTYFVRVYSPSHELLREFGLEVGR